MKKIIFIFLPIFLLLSCGGNDLDSSVTLDKNKSYSSEELYDTLVLKNDLDDKWNKSDFNKFVGFFNNGEFGKKEYYFYNKFNNNIQENGDIEELSKYTFPNDVEKIIKNLSYFNKLDLSKYNKGLEITEDFELFFKYTKNTEFINRVLFYNNKNDYFYSLNILNDINGACMLVSGDIESFREGNKGHVEDNGDVNILDYEYIDKDFSLSDIEYNDFIKNDKKINDGLFVYKGLINIVNKYVKSGYDKKYSDLFYKKFDEQLNVYYGFSEYTLFFAMKKHDNLMNVGFCDNFLNKYFLGK